MSDKETIFFGGIGSNLQAGSLGGSFGYQYKDGEGSIRGTLSVWNLRNNTAV